MNKTELPVDFIHEPPENYTYEVSRFDVMFWAFGVAIILNSFTTMVLFQKLFGDSTTPRSSNIMHQSIQKSVEIK